MMKLKFMALGLLAFAGVLKADAQAPTHVPLMDDTWRLVAQKRYVKNAQFKMVPAFPEKLQEKENSFIELRGYVIPLKAEMEYTNFMLAVVPYDQCPYCGQGDIPSMIEVICPKGISPTDKPVKIRGKLVLNKTGDKRSEIFLTEAEQVK